MSSLSGRSPAKPRFNKKPDFSSGCPFPLSVNPHYQPTAAESEEWLAKAGVYPDEDHKRAFWACNFGLVTAMSYALADAKRFHILCDFINRLFPSDDLTDEGNLPKDDGTIRANQIVLDALIDPLCYQSKFRIGEFIQDFWGQALSMGCSEGTRRRFIDSTELYLSAVLEEGEKRRNGVVLSLDEYLALRRDTDGFKMCFAMGEFGLTLNLPDVVFNDELLKTLQDCANDVAVVSRDMDSWQVEQAQGDKYNIIAIAKQEKNLTTQNAVAFAARLVLQRVMQYEDCRAKFPSYGPAVDQEIRSYIGIVEGWMRSSFRWSFVGEGLSEVKATTLDVKLLPFRSRIVNPVPAA
ncbi:hypothetical protein M407DRAFT_214327 [Tulasnella calospora MUT 4182]|uniref:Terpene synthase n=1 Tax=Tulasnella calospora MUT 4182 TaxID=1051891 RepID=A0A0C3MF69_9AGAM|nr:hypothetical protein M407DRAFT_214327 [Tulasnella calospora MUT 4182]